MSQLPRPHLHPRDELVQTMERIYRYRMTTTSGGNLSVRDGDDLWITPARVDKGSLRREDIVRVRADGSCEGRHRPSSEFPFHRSIYAMRPDLGAIVHAHPVALVAFSICGRCPDTTLFPQAAHVCGKVGFAPYALPGSEQLGRHIADTFAQGFSCVLLENHGVVVGGADLREAFQRFETLEFTAKTIIKASHLGPIHYLSVEQIALPRRRTPLPEFQPAPPSTEEKELRTVLTEFVRRGYRQRLMTSTEGSFSARLGEDAFLMTPYGRDRHALEPSDLVLVENGHRETGGQPSRATVLHRDLYRRHPRIHAIVNAIPVNATAFGVTRTPLDARTIPESYLFLRDVVRIPFGLPYEQPEEVAARIGPEQPVALLENDGVLVLGTSVLDAFDRLEVLESTAEAVVDSRAIGELQPMSAAVIEELVRAFAPSGS